MGTSDPLYVDGKHFHQADKYSSFALLSIYQKLPPYGKENANYTTSLLLSSALFGALLTEKTYAACKKISLSLFAKELSVEEASEAFGKALKKISWSASLKKELTAGLSTISDGFTKEGFIVAPVHKLQRNVPLVDQGDVQFCKRGEDIFSTIIDQIQGFFTEEAIQERLQKGYDVLDIHVEFLVGFVGTGERYNMEFSMEHPDLGSHVSMCSIRSSSSEQKELYGITFHSGAPQIIDIDTHVRIYPKPRSKGEMHRKFVKRSKNAVTDTQMFHAGLHYIDSLKKQQTKGVLRAIGSSEGVYIISFPVQPVAESGLIHTKDIVVKETQTPILETSAYSTGLFVSTAPHKDVVILESVFDVPLVDLLQFSAIVFTKEQAISTKEEHILFSYIREAGIPSLHITDAASFKEQKTCTFFADGHQGVVYPGILPYEEYPISQKASLDTFVLAKVYDPEMMGHAKGLPVSGRYLSLADILGYYGVHPSQFFTDETFSKELIQIAASFPDASSGEELFRMLLSRSMLQVAAGAHPQKVFVHLPDPDSDEFVGEIIQDTTTWHEVYYEAIKQVLTLVDQLHVPHVFVVSDVRSTPDEYKEWHEYLLGHTSLKSGVFIDVYKNFTLRSEFEQLTPYLFTKEIFSAEDTAQLSLWHRHMKKETKLIMLHTQVLAESLIASLMQKGIRGMVVETDMVLTYYHRMKTTERSIGRTGSETNIPLLVFLGMLGVLLVLVLMYISGFAGFGSPVDIPEQIQPEISPSELRKKIEEKEAEKKQAEFLAQRSSLQVSDFAQFQLLYPSWWRVSYWNGGVTMVDEKTGEYISIFIQKVSHPEPEKSAKITVGNVQGRVWSEKIGENEDVTTIIELPFEEDGTLEINGYTPLLSEILATMSFVEGGESVDSVSHWDIREKRFCAQMVTYAKRYADSACEAFPTPCDVPEVYTVCDGSEQ